MNLRIAFIQNLPFHNTKDSGWLTDYFTMLKILSLALLACASATHYENPTPNGCMSDEQAVQITGVTGAFCSPDCASAACPTE